MLWPTFAVELLQVELGLGQGPVVLVALRQPGHAGAAGLEGLDDFFAIAAQAQGDFGRGQFTRRRVEVLVEQLSALPATFVAFLQQGVLTQGSERFAADAQFDFGFFVHEGAIQALADNNALMTR